MADRGRPTIYDPTCVELVRKLCRLGATDHEVADVLGVDTATLYRWRHQHEEFCDALKVGKAAYDERVERALYARAGGYTYEAEEVAVIAGEIVRYKIVKHVPPDTGAAMAWLKNRRPDAWRDRREIEQVGETTVVIRKFDEPRGGE